MTEVGHGPFWASTEITALGASQTGMQLYLDIEEQAVPHWPAKGGESEAQSGYKASPLQHPSGCNGRANRKYNELDMENTIGMDVLPLGISLGWWKKSMTPPRTKQSKSVSIYTAPQGYSSAWDAISAFCRCVSQLTSSTVVQNSAAPGFGKGEVQAGHSIEEAHRPLVGTVI